MHRIVAHAHIALGPRAGKTAMPSMPSMPSMPALEALMRDASIDARHDVGDDDYTPAHERAWARAHGIDAPDGLVPFARSLAAIDGVPLDAQPWGLVQPVHAHVALDHVTVTAPGMLALDTATSRALFDAIEPLVTGDGWRLVFGHAHRWYASHAGLATLSTASIERTGAEGIERWLPRGPHARAWQRLQNECQMLLHTHAANDDREARGTAPINSLWLSGTGAPVALRDDVVIDERLRDITDEAAWRDAWSSIDRDLVAALHDAGDRLTLCGAHRSVTLAPRARRWWQRAASTDVAALLRDL